MWDSISKTPLNWNDCALIDISPSVICERISNEAAACVCAGERGQIKAGKIWQCGDGELVATCQNYTRIPLCHTCARVRGRTGARGCLRACWQWELQATIRQTVLPQALPQNMKCFWKSQRTHSSSSRILLLVNATMVCAGSRPYTFDHLYYWSTSNRGSIFLLLVKWKLVVAVPNKNVRCNHLGAFCRHPFGQWEGSLWRCAWFADPLVQSGISTTSLVCTKK